MMQSGEQKKRNDREAWRYIAILLAYHAPILVFMLWAVLSDPERFERIANDPDYRWPIVSISIALLIGSITVAYLALPGRKK